MVSVCSVTADAARRLAHATTASPVDLRIRQKCPKQGASRLADELDDLLDELGRIVKVNPVVAVGDGGDARGREQRPAPPSAETSHRGSIERREMAGNAN